MITDLTEGPVLPLLLRFAFPLFVSNALQAIYNLVDMVIVGNVIGKAGMSAVSIGGDILHLVTFVAMGFSSAGQVLIARAVGAGKTEEVRKTIGTMFSFLLGASVLVSLTCYGLRYSILRWLNTPPAAWDFAMDYLVTCTLGLLFIYGYNIVSAILRGMGDSRRPFVFIAIAAVLNILLDILFIRYLGLEVFGAALATVIGQGTSFVIALVYLFRRRESFGFDFRPESFRIDGKAFRKLVTLGVPMAIQSAAISFSRIVLMSWINMFDVTYSALAGMLNKIHTMCAIITQSFTTSGSSMAGQNLGAGKNRRVTQVLGFILLIGGSMALAATVLMIVAPGVVYGIFTADPDVLKRAGMLTVPLILNFYGAVMRSASFALINGSGHGKMNLAVAIIDGLIFRIGLAAFLGFFLKLNCWGFWMGDALSGFMPFVIGGAFYLSGRWKEK